MTATLTAPAPRAAVTPARARLHAVQAHMALWSLQGWLAMFFIAAGYTKLTEPHDILIHLMGWPEAVGLAWLRNLGALELVLATLTLVPLASWRIGRPLLLAAGGGLLVLETVFLVLHALRGDVGLAVTNLALVAITLPILIFRARGAPRA